MHESKPSQTAIWVALLRGIARFEPEPVVSDPVAETLLPFPYAPVVGLAEALPRTSRFVLAAADFVSRGRSRHLAFRTRAIDDAIDAAVRKGARQLVILGAGLDARAFRLESLRTCTVFEVDHPSTQRYKRAHVEGIRPIAKKLVFVDVDFERQNPADRLREAGYDPSVPSVFVWEGVTMYLTQDAIDRALDAIAGIACEGSIVAATYHTGERIAALSLAVRAVREPFVSTFKPSEIAAVFGRHGFTVVADESNPEWRARYVGSKTTFAVERLLCAAVDARGTNR